MAQLLLSANCHHDGLATLNQCAKSCKDNAAVATFLEQASATIREETERLHKARRRSLPRSPHLSDLIDQYSSLPSIPELDNALLVALHIFHYITHFGNNESQVSILEQRYYFVGIGAGQLAAAAAVCARSLSELIILGTECVKLAFRLGACISSTREAIEEDSEESWTAAVENISQKDVQNDLDGWHSASSISNARHAYISAVYDRQLICVSGPPNTIDEIFRGSKRLSVHRSTLFRPRQSGPYHAPHLFSEADRKKILRDDSRLVLQNFQGPQHNFFSSSTGNLLRTNNASELLDVVLNDILCKPVRWDLVSDSILSSFETIPTKTCNIYHTGSPTAEGALAARIAARLQEKGFSTTVGSMSPARAFVEPRPMRKDKIAIVGMAGRFPNADGHEELWNLLMQGLDVHKEVPYDRFDPHAHCDPSGKAKNKSHTPYGCFINHPGHFDPRFFQMSPREAAQTDPMGRLALVTAYEALEMSGYVPNRTPSTRLNRIGTFYGQTSDDWREINAAENIDTYFITGGVRAFAPGRINYFFKFSGPSFSIDTACSSSLAAIQLACTSLWAGDCDTACAGGLNVLTNPDIFAGLSKGQFLSKSGSCKTYDNEADGYCRGDGCATVILKRYSDAIKDKDPIIGSILATSTNHSAEAVSITHPHAGAQEYLYKKVLADAGVDSHDVDYVEMHGTGTQAGDGIEMTSVTNTFAPRHRQRAPGNPLHLGAVKANIGHGEASSGVNSLVKVLMMFRKNYIPPNIGIKKELNRAFPSDLDQRNVHIPRQAVPFSHNSGLRKRFVFLNNFSAAGGNTAMLIEDGKTENPIKTELDPRRHYVFTLSARSMSSLNFNISNLIQYLHHNPDTDLASLSYTTSARRVHHSYRVSVVAGNVAELIGRLEKQRSETYHSVPSSTSPKTAFMFTGQGCQYAHLGHTLYQHQKVFHHSIDSLEAIVRSEGFPSFMPLILSSNIDIEKLSPVVIQLGLSCIQVALASMWSNFGVEPSIVIGHSLGEYAALHVAGVINAIDLVRLVGTRARLLEAHCTPHTHGMLAVKGSIQALQATLDFRIHDIEVACQNGPGETVLCGPMAAIENTARDLSTKFKSTVLRVPYAFHSSQVEPILNSFRSFARTAVYRKPRIPILSPLLGSVIEKAEVVGPEYLCRHAREPVDFETALRTSVNAHSGDPCNLAWVEIGAHPICCNLLRSTLGSCETAASLRRGEDPWKTLATSAAVLFRLGVPFDFNEFHEDFSHHCHVLTDLPRYAFNNKNYWLDYHNNWTLSKGEASATLSQSSQVPPKLSTPSCQRITSEDLHKDRGTVIVQTDLTDERLTSIVRGHRVNKNALCPSSLYANQALTLAEYLYKELRPNEKSSSNVGLNVCKMEVPKPLILKEPVPAQGEHLQIECSADIEAGHAIIRYRSVTPDGKIVLVEHAHCTVMYENKSDWQEAWSTSSYMVQNHLGMLRQRPSSHKVWRGMAYKLFKSFVDYSSEYRGMEEVVFDSEQAEASATISFQTSDDEHFRCHPCWIDSLAHISGFILNGTDLSDSEKFLYISHGWRSMRFRDRLSASRKYMNYVRMVPQPNNVRSGDVWIFDAESMTLVGVVGGLRFQQIPRKAMDALLPLPKPSVSTITATGNDVMQRAPITKAIEKAVTQSTPIAQHTKSKIEITSEPTAEPKATVKVQSFIPNYDATIEKIMTIVSEETDVSRSELVDEVEFTSLGIDSLLSLTISARLRETLDMDIPSTLFSSHDTVGKMKEYFSPQDQRVVAEVASLTKKIINPPAKIVTIQESDSDASIPEEPIFTPVDEHIETAPSTAPETPSQSFHDKPRVEMVPNIDIGIQQHSSSVTQASSIDDRIATAIAKEFSTQSTTNRQKSIPQSPTHSPMTDVESALGMWTTADEPAHLKHVSTSADTNPVRLQTPIEEARRKPFKPPKLSGLRIPGRTSHAPKATSVLLQGSARTAIKRLFLLPDGSGSATSYTSIPTVSLDVCIYGLNCPYMKAPKQWTSGVSGVAAIYVEEIKRRQPQGPYHIGGWSAGGVLAYETASQLIAAGEDVDHLILIDCPSPKMASEPLPPGFHLFMNELGLLGTGGPSSTPNWLLPHFASTIENLGSYRASLLPQDKMPKALLIWARDGITKPNGPRPPCDGPEPAPMTWLLDKRTDFGDNGWGELLPTNKMTFAQVDGHHFSMVRDVTQVANLSKLIREGLDL